MSRDLSAARAGAAADLAANLAALAEMAGNLNENGKEMVVKAAFMVAAADGEFQDEEKELIGSIGEALEMSPAHMNGIITSMMQAR